MKSKCLLFLTLCLLFNACSNEDELTMFDLKRVKREMSEETRRYWRKADIDLGITYQRGYLVRGCKDAKAWEWIINFIPGYEVVNKRTQSALGFRIEHTRYRACLENRYKYELFSRNHRENAHGRWRTAEPFGVF